jgi:hypothetical protein
MIFCSAWGQIVDPTLVFNETNILAKELVTVTESSSATHNKKLRAGTCERNIDTSPITKKITDMILGVISDAA